MMRVLLITAILLASIFPANADWESDLKQNFDIVDTFDNIQDWQGTETGGYITTPSDMPKKIGGADSIWQLYFNEETPTSDWIADHGVGKTWKGKSLCINYNCLYDGDPPEEILGHGPGRLATFFGDGVTGNSGYKVIHLFFMLKIPLEFFPRDANGWIWLNGYLKTIEIASGFTDINHWGVTPGEYDNTCNPGAQPAIFSDYGINFNVFNIQTPGLVAPEILCYYIQPNYGVLGTEDCFTYEHYDDSVAFTQMRDIDLASQVLAEKFVGVEIIMDIGTIGNSDGQQTVNIYTEEGVLIATESRNNITALAEVDHLYNKVTFGGNLTRSGAAWSPENRLYYDDIIINDTEIAPTYFTLLAADVTPTSLKGINSKGVSHQ